MKVLTRRAASIVALAAMVAVPHASVSGAEAACPTECRRENAEVMCMTVVISDGDSEDVLRYYWSNGAD